MNSYTLFAVGAASALFLSGCGAASSGPSYADLVVTYNAELETLERLEKQRSDLVASFQRQLQPTMENAAEALSNVLNSASGGLDASDKALTPDQALDLAVASAQRTGQATSELLEAARSAGEVELDLTPEQAAAKQALDKELAELDKQIDQQKARVERARQARDAAESK